MLAWQMLYLLIHLPSPSHWTLAATNDNMKLLSDFRTGCMPACCNVMDYYQVKGGLKLLNPSSVL